MYQHPAGFALTQSKARKSNLHQQWVGANRPGSNDAHRLASDKAEVTKPLRDRILGKALINAIHCRN
jgi:hypothetical protein